MKGPAVWTGLGLSAQAAGATVTSLGVANTILRFLTDSPVGRG